MTSLIGVIDDDDEQRETVKGLLDEALPEGWKVLAVRPPATVRRGLEWIRDGELAVLLLDEKLNKSLAIPYSGHQLATAIRQQRPDFPVFVVTTYPDEDDLLVAEGDIDAIISRGDMGKKPEVYAKRFIRAGTRYVKQHEKDLARLSKLSTRLAQGLATAKEAREASALQATLQLTFFDHAVGSASAGVDELEAAITEAESLRKEMEASLKRAAPRKKKKKT